MKAPSMIVPATRVASRIGTETPAGGGNGVRARGVGGEAWSGPGAPDRRRRFRWSALLWSLLYPPKGHRVYPTLSGVVLISLALGIGTAAYNTANNILFITLALLLSCLILSGVLSWMNLARITWRLRIERALRAGQETVVVLEVRNGKRLLPTYGLEFEVRAGADASKSASLFLHERLDPAGGDLGLEWVWRPERRGAVPVELISVTSLFPFGFLRKSFPGDLRMEAIVWPAPVPYQRFPVLTTARRAMGETMEKVGQSGDLLALRRYAPGDSHRLIHWKASARTRQWLVRQFSAESQDGFSLHLDSSPDRWPRAEQFELMIGFVATLAEDLFKQGRLGTVAIDDGSPRLIRRLQDVEAFLDRLAVLRTDSGVQTRVASPVAPEAHVRGGRRNVLVFAPDGARGVAAFLDGQKAATA